MRRIVVFFMFIGFVFAIYQFVILDRLDIDTSASQAVTYFDGFERLDRDFWYVGEWETHVPAVSRVFLENNTLKIPVNETDKGPYVLSKPLLVEDKQIIKIKRRTKVSYGSDYFAGGLVLFETEFEDFEPDARRGLPFGNAVILVEYAHDQKEGTERPGTDAIRLLAPDWQTNKNYVLAEPIYDEWFEEQLVINTRTGRVTYTLNGKSYTLKSIPISKPYVRVWMHAYGAYTGHSVEVDYIEIKLTDPESESIDNDEQQEDL